MQELLPILQQNPQNQATAVYVLVAIGLIISTITVINLTFKKVEDESKPYYFIAALISIILFGASILMENKIDNDVKKAFENKEYTLTKKDKFLNFDSKSEYLKSKKFLIHFEDDSTIQIEDKGHYYEIDKTKEKVVE
jgi:hypothetical protein